MSKFIPSTLIASGNAKGVATGIQAAGLIVILGAGIIVAAAGTAVAQSPQPGETFRDCDNCPEMIVVPAGSFMMGSGPGDAARFPAE